MTRRTICLDKDESTQKSVCENRQRVLYPESTTTKEIYPKALEPKITFPIASEEIYPENQRVPYSRDNVLKEEYKVSELSDPNKYFEYDEPEASTKRINAHQIHRIARTLAVLICCITIPKILFISPSDLISGDLNLFTNLIILALFVLGAIKVMESFLDILYLHVPATRDFLTYIWEVYYEKNNMSR